jgi:hypothetical protein
MGEDKVMLNCEAPLSPVPIEVSPRIQKERKKLKYWVDFANPSQVVGISCALAVLMLGLHWAYYFYMDGKIITESRAIPLRFDPISRVARFDMGIHNLCRFKKFLEIRGALVRSRGNKKEEEATGSMTFVSKLYRDLLPIDQSRRKLDISVQFKEDGAQSSSFAILDIRLNRSFNVIDILAELKLDSSFTHIRITWKSMNPRTYTSRFFAYVGLAAMAGICYFTYCITFSYFLYADCIWSMVIFGLSWVSSNPFIFLLDWDAQFSSILIPVFLLIVRAHIIFKLKELRAVSDSFFAIATFLVLMIAYLYIDLLATVIHEGDDSVHTLDTWEVLRMVADLIYGVFAVGFAIRANDVDETAHTTRFQALLGMLMMILLGMLFGDVLIPWSGFWRGSVVPDLIRSASGCAYFAGFCLFFKRYKGKYRFNPFALFKLENSDNVDDVLNDY